ncbi:MAG TPA: sensor histidine kinase [Candidatus Bathyarchaeia archaeon]|nr:sensor histidine kinase [Candidatus Bathyarchaeia archaeon]
MNAIQTFLQTSYRNLRIKQKLFLLVSFIMIVAFSFTVIGSQYVFAIYDELLYQKSSQVLFMSSGSIENELKKVEKISYDITADLQIQNDLHALTVDVSEYEHFRLRSALTDKLLNYSNTEDYIQSIQLFDARGREYAAGTSTVSIPPDKLQNMLRVAREAKGSSEWIFPDKSDMSLIALREIRYYKNLSFDHVGTLIIRINLNKIVGQVSKGSQDQGGDIMMRSGTRIIYPIRSEQTTEQIPIPSDQSEGYRIETRNGETYFVAYLHSTYANWTYLHAFPYDQIFERIVTIKYYLLLVYLLMFFVCIMFGMRFAKGITHPIENLVSTMLHVRRGEFEKAEARSQRTKPMQMDEIGILHSNFNLMIQRINELIRENYTKQLVIKETEFKALQAQIKPHFLYNTLESINWLAKVNQQVQISRMVESLGFLLRSSISPKEPMITLEEEMEIIQHYVTIQSYRFEDRLHFSMDIPQEVRDCCLPKLTLQPLLENAIQYALEPMIEPCSIRITTILQEDGFTLVVMDNGPGMDLAYLEQWEKRKEHTKGQGIGLKNIDERIKLSFGEAYGIKVESERGKGTHVHVMLPYKRGIARV